MPFARLGFCGSNFYITQIHLHRKGKHWQTTFKTAAILRSCHSTNLGRFLPPLEVQLCEVQNWYSDWRFEAVWVWWLLMQLIPSSIHQPLGPSSDNSTYRCWCFLMSLTYYLLLTFINFHLFCVSPYLFLANFRFSVCKNTIQKPHESSWQGHQL